MKLKALVFVATLLFCGLALLLHFWQIAQMAHNLTMCKSNLSDLSDALESYAAEHSGQYPTSLSHLVPQYLQSPRSCPTANIDTYSSSYRHWSNPDQRSEQYEIACQGSHHSEAGTPTDRPAYSRAAGLIER